jgi:hypothetical protein
VQRARLRRSSAREILDENVRACRVAHPVNHAPAEAGFGFVQLTRGSEMRKLTMMGMMLGIAGATAGCMDVPDDTAAQEGEVGVCREIKHFSYTFSGATYGWDVTTENTGRQFVDEWLFGHYGTTHVQYRVSPVWSDCPNPNEIVRLTRPGVTLIGSHNCLPYYNWEEYHGSDFQRLLKPRVPFITSNCDP